ncbi:hypothetical protein V6N11_023451 [Hibiscus sabdariffa]|uniref:Uncharacterized protein n=1 Tax=Hibiscus sabdariffa TaxID=183260 RepID=A0ABR2TM99_9ROSI
MGSSKGSSQENNDKGSEPLQPGNSSNKQQGILVQQGSSPKGIEAENSENSLQFASVDQVKILESSLSKGNHVAVQIAVPTDNLIPKARNGRVLPMSITGSGAGKDQGISTGVSKKGARLKKKDPKSGTRFSLAGLVENLSTELEKAQSDIVQHGTGMSVSLHGDADEVQWQENTAFDRAGFEDMQD